MQLRRHTRCVALRREALPSLPSLPLPISSRWGRSSCISSTVHLSITTASTPNEEGLYLCGDLEVPIVNAQRHVFFCERHADVVGE